MTRFYGNISEVFLSVQGEGLYIGLPQVFVRFMGCILKCAFCDEVLNPQRSNLFDVDALIREIERKDGSGIADSISLTGGEPLIQVNFLYEFLQSINSHRWKIYLESNGILPDALKWIIGLIDIVAMDIKLPSSSQQGPFWSEHKDFLSIAKDKEVFVKIVITPSTTESDLEKALQIVSEVDKNIPFVLQPVTPVNEIKQSVDIERLLQFQRLASGMLNNVRIIPQTHKIIGIK